jgi:hypothetical protein
MDALPSMRRGADGIILMIELLQNGANPLGQDKFGESFCDSLNYASEIKEFFQPICGFLDKKNNK